MACECLDDRIGAGLRNLGNTCFLNAVLQCLLHTAPLVDAVRSLHHRARCSSDADDRFCSLCALQDLMDCCHRASVKIVSPEPFVENLTNISSLFIRYQQEDAHEFLHCLLDNIDKCFRELPVRLPSLPDSSIINPTFGGRLCSVVRCCDCGHCSETFDPVLDLSLEIDDVDTINDALYSFTRVEKIGDPETKFTCEGCKSQVSVEKQLMLEQVPPVIMLHLKRFKNDNGFFDKIDKHIEYPLELDLKPFVRTNYNVDVKYDLYALVVHSGWASHSGHYYCYVRSSPEVWHKMDDCMVSRTSVDEVIGEQAYILFYIKHGSSPWFSSAMQHQKLDGFSILEKQVKMSPSSVLDCTDSFNAGSCNVENYRVQSMKTIISELAEHAEDTCEDSLVNNLESDVPAYARSDEPCTSKTGVSDDAEAEQPQSTTMSSGGPSTLEELVLDIFPDEPLEDEKEKYLPPATQGAKSPRKLTPCSRRQETLSWQLKQMRGSRRHAILQCIQPALRPNIPEHSTSKKRLHSESLVENKNDGNMPRRILKMR